MLTNPIRIKMSIKNLKVAGFDKEDLESLKELGTDGLEKVINALTSYKEGLDRIQKANQEESFKKLGLGPDGQKIDSNGKLDATRIGISGDKPLGINILGGSGGNGIGGAGGNGIGGAGGNGI